MEPSSTSDVIAEIHTGFAALRAWLEPRLKLQEDLLDRLTNIREASGSPNFGDNVALRELARPNINAVSVPQAWEGAGESECDDLAGVKTTAVIAIETASGKASPHESRMLLPNQVLEACSALPEDGGGVPKVENKDRDSAADLDKNGWGIKNQEWAPKLMDIFDQLDLSMTGSLTVQDLLEVCKDMNYSHVQALDIFKYFDKSSSGVIDLEEWLDVGLALTSKLPEGEGSLVCEFIKCLLKRQETQGRIYREERKRTLICMLRHDKPLRVAWDIFMLFILFGMSITMPFVMGFESNDVLDTLDNIYTICFFCDIFLNFRTTYLDSEEQIIADGKKIALNYLRSWFALDFISTVPFDLITAGFLPNLLPARLLRIVRLARVLKFLRFLRISKIKKLSQQFVELLEESSTPNTVLLIGKTLRLVLVTFVMCHWLACFMAAVDSGSLDSYLGVESSSGSRYLAALYWAMTTLSTVGYGDITPTSDVERVYSMLAMVVGGTFYGYIIGSITNVMSDDPQQRAYLERIGLVTSWLASHEDDIPYGVRRRIRKHCQEALSAEAAIDDARVVADLSPQLQAETASYIIHVKVRCNPMFVELPTSGLVCLLDILKKVVIDKGCNVVNYGDPGTAMFILVDGLGRFCSGSSWKPSKENPVQDDMTKGKPILEPRQSTSSLKSVGHKLDVGESFGEEIIFELEETYMYTIATTTASTFFAIPETGFKEQFRNMPSLHKTMYRCFLSSKGIADRVDDK